MRSLQEAMKKLQKENKLNEANFISIEDRILTKVKETLIENGLDIDIMKDTCSILGISEQLRTIIHNILKENEFSVNEYVYGEDFDFTLNNSLELTIDMLEDIDEVEESLNNESKLLEEDNSSNIVWEDIEEYTQEQIEQIREVINNLDLKVEKAIEVSSNVYEVIVKDNSSDMVFRLSYHKNGDEYEGDWSQYIFNKDNLEDITRRAIQTSYNKNTNDTIAFEEFDSIAYQYLLDNQLITENKEDKIKLPSEENPEETKNFINQYLDNKYNKETKVGIEESVEKLNYDGFRTRIFSIGNESIKKLIIDNDVSTPYDLWLIYNGEYGDKVFNDTVGLLENNLIKEEK